MAAQYHLNRGVPKDFLTAEGTVGAFTSPEFGIIARTGDADGGERIRWQTSFSVAPSAVSVALQGSINPNATTPIWSDLDTSTNVNGEVREVVANIRGLRVKKNSQTGAGAITATVCI